MQEQISRQTHNESNDFLVQLYLQKTRTEMRALLGMSLYEGLRRRQVGRRISRWFKERSSDFVYMDGCTIDAMSIKGVKMVNAFYSVESGLSLDAVHVMRTTEE